MNGITVPMAIYDFVPVALFFLAAVLLQRDLYGRMVKGAFSLLAAGSILVLLGGVYKALWKILYACGVCDYPVLAASFFPIQAPGFLLVFLAMLAYLTRKKPAERAYAVAAAPVFESNLPFLAGQIVGCAGFQWCLFALALRRRQRLAAVLFAVSFVFMMAMGYLSARFDNSAPMHWLAQSVNLAGNGALLWGVVLLHRAGFRAAEGSREPAPVL